MTDRARLKSAARRWLYASLLLLAPPAGAQTQLEGTTSAPTTGSPAPVIPADEPSVESAPPASTTQPVEPLDQPRLDPNTVDSTADLAPATPSAPQLPATDPNVDARLANPNQPVTTVSPPKARARRSASTQPATSRVDPRVTGAPATPVAPTPEPEPAPPSAAQPIEPPPPASSPSSWPLLVVLAFSLLALGGVVQWLRLRARAPRVSSRDAAEPPPAAPRLTCSTHVSHALELSSPPSIRLRLTARAVPDHGRQRILPPSTPLADNQGEGELVELIEHRMSSIHEPKVEVLVNGKRVFVLPLEIALELEFRGVQLLLRGGRVREVRLGELEGKGRLQIAGHEVAEQALGELTLPGVLKLDPGIPLRA